MFGQHTRYVGTLNVTETGRTCQTWSEHTPHRHTCGDKPGDFPDGEFPDNYCRSPFDGPEDYPWCYTTDPDRRWEYCDVRICGELIEE